MAGSVYKVIEIIGTSDTSWEEAAKTAVEEAASHLEDLRVAEIVEARHAHRGQQGRRLSRQR